ncbi:hypothetical protein [Terriglobus sp. RCC_193]|uniref:hypothetical protein n=1 Tax=Terriglobus sp. RCC_193 TaxID=3239218 RepID=UPI003523992D
MSCALLALGGCSATSVVAGQRFTLVNDPSGISDKIPNGALALDTRTGQLCYTISGNFTGAPALPMCSDLAQKNHE